GWRGDITDVQVGGNSLDEAAWSTSAGELTLIPANDALLQSAGTKSVTVIATGWSNGTASQPIAAGAVAQLVITVQPTAPAENGGPLAVQPAVALRDQYNNATTSTASVTATSSGGAWNLAGGTN